ncbi:MAG: LamG domain-containing protein [Saprospiraceae bacterium]|nr:LamG domain-containing protein [Lewinellaceae bacterium]MBP6810054.1 LamG domain-containing protein [Saprospiraceae bacterium]
MKNLLLLLLLIGSNTAILHAQTTCANRCLNFDGKNDYIQLSKSPLKGNANFTLEVWFRSLDSDSLPNCRSGNFERIIGCGGSRFEIGECAGNFSFYTNASGVVNSGVLTNDGKWHYFAATKDATTFRFFLDGDLVMKYDLPTGTAFNLDNTFRIGRWPGSGGLSESWQGDIDEIRIWDSALPEAALLANRDCQLTGKETGLIGYYNFDQGNPAGSNSNLKTLTDLSVSNNSGIIYGFALTGTASNWMCSGTPQAVFCGDPMMITPGLRSPTSGEVVQSSPTRKLRFDWSAPYGQVNDVQYKIEIFKNTSTERDSIVNLERVFADSFYNRLNTEVMVSELGPEPNKLERYTWQITTKYSGLGSQCATGCASPQQGFFLQSNPFDVNVSVTYSQPVCAQPAYTASAKVRYNLTITLQNLSLGTGTGADLNFGKHLQASPQILLKALPGNFDVINDITPTPSFPPILLYNASFTFSFIVEVPLGTTNLIFQPYFHSVAVGHDGFPIATIAPPVTIPLPPCICDPCRDFAIQVTGTTPPIGGSRANFSINQNITINAGARPIIRVLAEIIYFEHSTTCCPTICNTKPNSHAEFISGTLLNSGGTDWQNSGKPMDFIDGSAGPGDQESAAVTWYSITSAGASLNNTPIHLEIAVPNLGGPTPCECYNLCIRYSFFDKDCKVCEAVRSYSTCSTLPSANCR